MLWRTPKLFWRVGLFLGLLMGFKRVRPRWKGAEPNSIIKDRSKDIIISGGENISSVEVENVLYKHQRVVEVAVVAMPHPVWGETPCAFVVLGKGEEETVTREGDLIEYCRENMPRFMCPRKVVFLDELPKNGNGKILKPKLRDIAKGLVVVDDEKNVNSKKVHKSIEKHGLTSRL